MLNAVDTILACKLCEQILDKPVNLPCGETICGHHEALFRDSNTSKCEFCDKEHKLQENEHFPPNKIAELILEVEINKLNLCEDYNQAHTNVEHLNQLKDLYEEIKTNSKEFISQKFEQMRKRVRMIREEIIQKVNECSEKIISDIDAYENECQANLSANKLLNEIDSDYNSFLPEIKNDLKVWEEKLSKLYFNKDLFKEINEKSVEYISSLKSNLKTFTNKLELGSEKKLEFETKYRNIFYTFCEHIGFST
jgi:hypothetical protein